jgi:hypothetical protein
MKKKKTRTLTKVSFYLLLHVIFYSELVFLKDALKLG